MSEETVKKGNKRIFYVAMAAVVLIAILIGIGIYNTPENCLQRQLDLGNRYLEEQNYEQAALAFEQAIAIDDRCVEAYAGGLEAYLGAGDEEKAQNFYTRTLAMLSGLDAGSLAENRNLAVELYLDGDKVYEGDWGKMTSVLEEGYTITGEDVRIKNKLIETYINKGETETQNGAYKEALVAYDRILNMDGDDKNVLESLEKCLIKYMEYLFAKEEYDEVKLLIEKYENIVTDIAYDEIKKDVERLASIKAEEEAAKERAREAVEILQSDNWVDILYQKIITKDTETVFAIMELPDFIKKCEEFPHSEEYWSVDYSLLTSDGKIFWALKAIDSNTLIVSCSPNRNADNYDIGGEALVGKYEFSIDDGERTYTEYEDGDEENDTYHA